MVPDLNIFRDPSYNHNKYTDPEVKGIEILTYICLMDMEIKQYFSIFLPKYFSFFKLPRNSTMIMHSAIEQLLHHIKACCKDIKAASKA